MLGAAPTVGRRPQQHFSIERQDEFALIPPEEMLTLAEAWRVRLPPSSDSQT